MNEWIPFSQKIIDFIVVIDSLISKENYLNVIFYAIAVDFDGFVTSDQSLRKIWKRLRMGKSFIHAKHCFKTYIHYKKLVRFF